MENASKALIIAGSILVSILIIGLGVFIFSQAQSTLKKVDLSSTEAQTQNQQFEAYFGNNKSAAEVKQLLSLIRSNNITGKKNEKTQTIGVVYGSDTTASTSVNTISTKLKAGKTYTVEPYDDNGADDDIETSGTKLTGY